MQIINTHNTIPSATSTTTTLPSPPSSPVNSNECQATSTPKMSRKRALSISFIQNQDESEDIMTTKKQKKSNVKAQFDFGCLLKYLDQKGSSPNTCDSQLNRSLLSWACIGRSEAAIQNLLGQVYLDINMKSGPNKTTALHEASLLGFHHGVDLLLAHPDIDINAVDGQGQTPLHYAVQTNQVECIQRLLSLGARMDLRDMCGRLPIHLAAMRGYHHCISMLLKNADRHDTNPLDLNMLWTRASVDNNSTIEYAITAGYVNTLELLLDQDKELRYREEEGLVDTAVVWNRIECLESLIKYKCRLNNDSKIESPLFKAVQQRKIDLVRVLSSAGANPCLANGHNPSLLYAANHGFLDMVPLVLSLKTSKECIQQALLLASSMGPVFRDQLGSLIVRSLKALSVKDQ
ncbi:ankyrin [Backusella circina FSU 941]|nr:ankyrin [Backusella circina FSU 941]